MKLVAKTSSRALRWVIAAHLAVLVSGIAIAFAAASPTSAQYAYAANHCTRYHPEPYYVDSHCTTNDYSWPGSGGNTTGVALRDQNYMYVEIAADELCVWYEGYAASCDSGGFYISQGPSVGYQKAYCWWWRGIGGQIRIRCTTLWHD